MKPISWGDSNLAETLDALRQAEARVETPPHVETALLAAWDRSHAPRSRVRARSLWREVTAVAAAVTIAVGLAHLGRELRRTTLTSIGIPLTALALPRRDVCNRLCENLAQPSKVQRLMAS